MTPVKVSRNFPDDKMTREASGIRGDSEITKEQRIETVAVENFI